MSYTDHAELKKDTSLASSSGIIRSSDTSPPPPVQDSEKEDSCAKQGQEMEQDVDHHTGNEIHHEIHHETRTCTGAGQELVDTNNSNQGQEQQEQQGKMKTETTTSISSSTKPQIQAPDPVMEDWIANGRRGDLRMHRAVAARLAKPELSLLQALEAGGFKFPDLCSNTKKDEKKDDCPQRPIYDTGQILLRQRKNQLSRRLRLYMRKKLAEEKRKQKQRGVVRGRAAGVVLRDMMQQEQYDRALRDKICSLMNNNNTNKFFHGQNIAGYPSSLVFPDQQNLSLNPNMVQRYGGGGYANQSLFLPPGATPLVANQETRGGVLGNGVAVDDSTCLQLELELMNKMVEQQRQQNLLQRQQQQELLALSSLANFARGGHNNLLPSSAGAALPLQVELMNIEQQRINIEQQRQQNFLFNSVYNMQQQQQDLAALNSSLAGFTSYDNAQPSPALSSNMVSTSIPNDDTNLLLAGAQMMASPLPQNRRQLSAASPTTTNSPSSTNFSGVFSPSRRNSAMSKNSEY